MTFQGIFVRNGTGVLVMSPELGARLVVLFITLVIFACLLVDVYRLIRNELVGLYQRFWDWLGKKK